MKQSRILLRKIWNFNDNIFVNLPLQTVDYEDLTRERNIEMYLYNIQISDLEIFLTPVWLD